jgi:cysteine sulfinate desulfinase/cysteine desulfurase-like protein/glyoxylase-like metal-dependent hydrolase (beta-lactamase superfamily II)/rhodanese-related sulfurtransferase
MKNAPIATQAYFDCNATTPVLPIAADAAMEAMRILYGNPSSSHLVGLQAKFILESSRRAAGKAVGAEPEQITFTSGATEAIQTAVFSALQHFKSGVHSAGKLLYCATEHKAVPQALHYWVKALELPLEIFELPVDSQGLLKLDILRRELPHAVMLCTMAVNNETGVIQDLAAIESLLHELRSNTLWMVDCVQALGKIPLRLSSQRIDYAPFSGHKLYAPKGIGFLYVRKNTPFFPLIVGGGQEKGLRSGTENLPGVAAFGAVLNLLNVEGKSEKGNALFHSHSQLEKFRKSIVTALKEAFPKIEFNSPFENSVPTTINFSVPGFASAELLDVFDSAGLRLSAGSACSSASAKPSHVLDAMGVPTWRSLSALRLSFGPHTSEKEIEKGCKIIRESAIALQNSCLLGTSADFEAPETLRDGIIQLRSGSSNSWIIANRESRNCIIIDPCDTAAERIERYVRCQNLEVLAILDTHSHADHDSIRPILQRILSEQMASSKGSFDELGWPISPNSPILTSVVLENGEAVPAIQIQQTSRGEWVLATLKTPGHTGDSQTFLYGMAKKGRLRKEDTSFAFPGDTVLSGGLGRTNFSTSNSKDMFRSLRSLQEVLSPSTLLCPAHDYNQSFATSLNTEKEQNPLLALALSPMTPMTLQMFEDRKKEIDTELSKLEETFQGMVCGVTPTSLCIESAKATVSPDQLKKYTQAKKKVPLIIDVREPQEYSIFKGWKKLGFDEPPKNVPLSRFVNLMEELLSSQEFDREILLICRSGNRSLHATKSLRRLGFSKAVSLEGGVALMTSIDSKTHG